MWTGLSPSPIRTMEGEGVGTLASEPDADASGTVVEPSGDTEGTVAGDSLK